jgi:hypothetical protein
MRRMLAVAAAAAVAGCSAADLVPPPRPSGTLYLAGRDPGTLITVDVAAQTATKRHLPQLGPGDPPFMVAFTGGRVVVFRLGGSTSLNPDLSDPRSLGDGWYFVPSATPGRIWNLLLPRGDQPAVRNFRGVREVTVDGRTTFTREARLPGGALAAVVGGLVVQSDSLQLWDPVSARVTRHFPGPAFVAAAGSLVASCSNPCRTLHVTDTTTGRDTRAHALGYDGAFSPDGKRLAVRDEEGAMAVVDTADGRVTPLDARAAPGGGTLAWAASGWLFYEAPRNRIGAWRPGQRARVLAVTPGPFVAMAVD